MKYKVVDAYYLVDLEEKVNKSLEGGWRPQGGVAFHPVGFKDRWIQAMVKE
jgi:hypothetical protein